MHRVLFLLLSLFVFFYSTGFVPEIAITAAPLVTSIIPAAAKAASVLGVVGTTFYSLFAKSRRHSSKTNISSSSNYLPPPPPKKPRNEDDFRKKHPHGRYEDVGYHKNHQYGKKSARPTDGQAALDDSHLIEGQDRHRISINNQEIVVLYETSPGLFHGHVRTWSNLTDGMRNTLIHRGLTSIKGKFLK